MTSSFSLSAEERDVIASILSTMPVRQGGTVTLEYLLSRWAGFVSSIENVYDFTIYDYTNDLSVRDLLEEVLQACPEPLRKKIWDEVKELDDRFASTTKLSTRPLLKIDARIGWWWYRVPLEPGDELLEDLIAEGFLAD
jgi:hypothetical protein